MRDSIPVALAYPGSTDKDKRSNTLFNEETTVEREIIEHC
jgi:hypothetical protein